MSEVNENQVNDELEEEFEIEIDDPSVMTVNIDDTLSVSGEAADAKAVGDALALKADASSVTAISVNGQSADNQGKIIIDGGDIKMSSTDTTTLKAAIESAAGRTATDIPMSSEIGAATIAERIAEIAGEVTEQTAADIPMSDESGAPTIAQKISAMDTVATANSNAITALQAKGGDTIKLEAGGTETVKEAIEKRIASVNGEGPDETGNVEITHALTADNLTSSASQSSIGEFTRRTAGGTASIQDGPAWMSSIRGNRSHVGYVAEVLNMTVTTAPREPGQDLITATIDRDTFVAYVDESGTTNLVYTTSWSESPALYGVTVEGTPVSGDQITIAYTKEDRGTIIQSKPEKMISTGYNLFNPTAGYAVGLKYSSQYGFAISGTYTAVKWAATSDATSKTTITPVDGLFDIPANGYIFVEGASTDTMVFMTWSDWILGTDWPSYAAYSESVIDLSALFDDTDDDAPFPHGLLRAGDVRDEIDFNTGLAISNIERLAYSAENLAAAVASGRAYECDTNYIYLERASAISTEIEIDGQYTASDHGLEMFTVTQVPVYAIVIYGNNLKNKLERDVLTISQQSLTSTEQGRVRSNIGAAAAADLTSLSNKVTNINKVETLFTATAYRDDINRSFELDTDHTMLAVFLYYGSINAAYRTIAIIPHLSTANFYCAVGYNTTYDIVRFAVSSDSLTLLSNKNGGTICIGAIYGIG